MTRENRPTTREAEQEAQSIRKRRVPLGGSRERLKVDPGLIPTGKRGRWINDEGARLQEALAGGYNFLEVDGARVGVSAEEGKDRGSGYVRTLVGTDRQEKPMYGYLMVIDEELYQADQRAKNRNTDEIERSLKRGKDDQGAPGREGRYIPKEGIKIESGIIHSDNKP